MNIIARTPISNDLKRICARDCDGRLIYKGDVCYSTRECINQSHVIPDSAVTFFIASIVNDQQYFEDCYFNLITE